MNYEVSEKDRLLLIISRLESEIVKYSEERHDWEKTVADRCRLENLVSEYEEDMRMGKIEYVKLKDDLAILNQRLQASEMDRMREKDEAASIEAATQKSMVEQIRHLEQTCADCLKNLADAKLEQRRLEGLIMEKEDKITADATKLSAVFIENRNIKHQLDNNQRLLADAGTENQRLHAAINDPENQRLLKSVDEMASKMKKVLTENETLKSGLIHLQKSLSIESNDKMRLQDANAHNSERMNKAPALNSPVSGYDKRVIQGSVYRIESACHNVQSVNKQIIRLTQKEHTTS
jgi:hypothetical protein